MSDHRFVDRHVLMDDTRLLLTDMQELLRLIADQAGDNVTDLRFRLEDKIARYTKNLTRLQHASVDKVRQVGHATDEYVHHEPWKAIGIAAGVAFILGMLVCRCSRE